MVWHLTTVYFGVLGSIAYTYTTETYAKSLQATATPGRRKPLNNRSLRGVFVGYADTQKAWRVLLCGTGEIVNTCHTTFDKSNSYSKMELWQQELARLGRRLLLEYTQPSCIEASVPTLVFYAEPIPENDAKSTTPDELHHLDEFIREFDVDGLQEEMVNLPDISTYNGREGSQVLWQNRGHGSQLQALIMFTGNTLSEKQIHAEALVPTENLVSMMENSKISELGALVEPKTYQAAMASANALHWRKAIDKEGQSLISHGTWKLMHLPNGKKALTSRWIFKIKYDADGNVERCKARLVIRGFEQVKYIDYDEIFAPVIRLEYLRIPLTLVAIMDWECHQTDVDIAFLNGDMEEEVYMLQPEGLGCLKRGYALYGLKQAPRAWHKRLTDFLKKNGYEKLNSDASIYMKLMIFSEFNSKDMGEVHYILGLRIRRDQDTRTLSIDQITYARNTLEKFNLSHANPARTPSDTVVLTKAFLLKRKLPELKCMLKTTEVWWEA
ncbi:Gag-pol Polyprotein [Phytophthora megakarya]|uniref:Gag-pol Polyprotein n=1 Tax=Phytophthora megakarya TaxID=4795 RepID=A0A225W7G1_9STRA|nr:Gag-pol Polyprotein [Phytophthora megakarya]